VWPRTIHAMARRLPIAWHALSVGRVLAVLRSSTSGLSTAEAWRRLGIFGPNELPRAAPPGLLELARRQTTSPLQLALLGSGVLAFALGRPVDGTVVVSVVVLNVLMGTLQERRATRAIAALDALIPDLVTVVRDGLLESKDAVELVPGDVVLLEPGDRVAADMRLISTARCLLVNEASLTGEALPAQKQASPVPVASALGDRSSMLFAGTIVATGTARAVVVGTAARTELGKIAALLRAAKAVVTPLTRSLAQLGEVLTRAIGLAAFAIALIALRRGFLFIDAVRSAVSIAVAAIPSGLPAIITVALAVAVRRMAARNAVVRTLPSVETLGSTTVICTDKTGTLTRGEMTVRWLWAPSGLYEMTGAGYTPFGALKHHGSRVQAVPADVMELLAAATLCNDAAVRPDGTAVGDSTEIGLVVAAEKLALASDRLRATWHRTDAIPFEAVQRYMATLHEGPDGVQLLVAKGAPEAILRYCRFDVRDGIGAAEVGPIVDQLAARGARVLAVAARRPAAPLTALTPEELQPLRLLGLAAMVDPPREEAVQAIRACRRAGIRVKMVTGDHPITARAIGVEVGIATAKDHVVTGNEIASADDAQLGRASARTNIWARVEPEHKLRLVRALQARGEVVAMTGDGVNDAPALKQADIGVAMGRGGTAAAKQAADIVLADDNFATVAAAVEGGRRCYENLIKAVTFVVPTNLGQSVTVLIGVLFFPVVDGVPILPIVPLQILWVNLVTGVTLAVPLAFEPAAPDLMWRSPRARDAPIFNAALGLRCLAVGAVMAIGSIGLFLYEYYVEPGPAPDLAVRRAQTMAATTLVLFQVFYLGQCRTRSAGALAPGSEPNRALLFGVGLTLAMQVAFVHLAPMNLVFHSAPLSLADWMVSALVAATVVPVVALQEALFTEHQRRTSSPPRRGRPRA